jgi:putative restriction endonuclease
VSASNLEDLDQQVRLCAFRFLEEHTRTQGETFARDTLEEGFEFRGKRVKLVGPQGIFKPKILPEFPLSILTVAVKPGEMRPYDDGFLPDGTVTYRYRGTDPQHHDNVRLRNTMRKQIPLVYFHGTVPGRYVAAWPVYVISDDPSKLAFRIDVDSKRLLDMGGNFVAEANVERRYGERTTRQRLHQQSFRARVLKAYREHCAICRLRHAELLDAAHIIPDADPEGEPRVPNGISLCKLHHAAFDRNFVGIRPDLIIEVRREILEEDDGPMLRHGLQGVHHSRILIPHRAEWRPDPAALEQKYESFRSMLIR